MPSFNTTRIVRHGAAQMFDLVADVESYPQFLPLCTGLRVRRRVESGEGVETIVAEMQVGYKAIRETFTSRTLGLLMGAMFDSAFRRFAEAFEARADQIYGK